jgi:hypothetical protein
VLAWACLGWFAWYGPKGLALGVCAALVVSPIPRWLRAAGKVTSKFPSRWGFRASAEKALAAGQGVSRRDYAAAFVSGSAAYGLEWLQIALLLGFLTPQVPDVWRLAGMMAMVSLANSFQVTLAGLGVREGLSMFLLGHEGVGPEAAVLAAFLQSALILFLPALLGLAVKPVALYADGPDGEVKLPAQGPES